MNEATVDTVDSPIQKNTSIRPHRVETLDHVGLP